MLVAWAFGFALYQWLSPVGPSWWTDIVAHTHPASVSFTASLPSFAAAFALAAVAILIAPSRFRGRAADRARREPLVRPD
jgi:hypothetical protein